MARSVGSQGDDGRRRRAALDLREALGSALDIRLELERAYPLLLRVVDADCAALGVSRSSRAEDFEWLVAGLPSRFFSAYAEMAPHDFVRDAVARRPNVVLRDQEMIPRRQLETNMMYHRARELGAPLEQVMAVMLHVSAPAPAQESGGGWQSGLSVYRDRRRPFQARERAALQAATPALVNAVRNCRMFGAAASWQAALSAVLEDRGAAAILVAPPAVELARTARAAALIERWFEPHERRLGRLPPPLAAAIEQAAARGEAAAPWAWSWRDADAALVASIVALPAGSEGRARWMLLLQELPRAVPVPAAWRDVLTAAESVVCAAVLRGWDNQLVAACLGRAEQTIKKQLQSIFDKLGVASRAALIARAAELRSL